MCDFFLLGLPGLVQAYQTCIQSVQLYGPTNISPIISHVAHFAQQAAQTPTATVSNMHNFLSDLWPGISEWLIWFMWIIWYKTMTGWALSVKCWPTEREQHPVLNILEMKVLSVTLQSVRPSCGRDDEEEMTVQSPVPDFTKTIALIKYFFLNTLAF